MKLPHIVEFLPHLLLNKKNKQKSIDKYKKFDRNKSITISNTLLITTYLYIVKRSSSNSTNWFKKHIYIILIHIVFSSNDKMTLTTHTGKHALELVCKDGIYKRLLRIFFWKTEKFMCVWLIYLVVYFVYI